jgi:hypothetical protein
MLGFLLGCATGTIVAFNGPRVRRLLATLLIKGEDTAESVNHHVLRLAAQVQEDWEDIVAEARFRRASSVSRPNVASRDAAQKGDVMGNM